jgi:putative addiction module component (TIGR02574 family)
MEHIMSGTKKLIDEALSLPVEERAIIADSLLKSLNVPETETDKEWSELAKQRLKELVSGEVKAIPGNEVFDRIHKRFAK